MNTKPLTIDEIRKIARAPYGLPAFETLSLETRANIATLVCRREIRLTTMTIDVPAHCHELLDWVPAHSFTLHTYVAS